MEPIPAGGTSQFTGYFVPVIVLTKETPKEAVCTVFEKVDTGGVPLNVFELLTATYASDNFRPKDDWQSREQRLRRRRVNALESSDFLQAVTLLATRARQLEWTGSDSDRPGVSCKRKDILRLSLDEYQKWADAAEEGFDWAATLLAQEGIFTASDVPYRTQLVPLAAIRATIGDEIDNLGIFNRIRQWYWSGVLGELYGGAIETRFARDLEQVVEWVTDDGPPPGTVSAASFNSSRLLTLRTRNSAAYKGIYALLMREGCLDWQKHKPITLASFFDYRIDIHHIFPKAWCTKAENDVDPARRESIVNKTAISFDTNRSVGGRPPSEYLPTLQKKASVSVARMLETVMGWEGYHLHMFKVAGLRFGQPDEFGTDIIDERQLTLQQLLPRVGSQLQWSYDFGDGWEHVVAVEAIEASSPDVRYPECMAGERACPPEDCGGVWGYQNLREAIADPAHAEHEQLRDWAGPGFDPEAFDQMAVTAHLRRVR